MAASTSLRASPHQGATNGGPDALPSVGSAGGLRKIGDLSADEKRVICERHFGWEGAKIALLAKIFDAAPQTISAVIRAHAWAKWQEQADAAPRRVSPPVIRKPDLPPRPARMRNCAEWSFEECGQCRRNRYCPHLYCGERWAIGKRGY